VRYTELTYDEALAVGVRVMDTSAFVLANEQNLTMHVFDVAAAGVMRRICEGEELGTRISTKLAPLVLRRQGHAGARPAWTLPLPSGAKARYPLAGLDATAYRRPFGPATAAASRFARVGGRSSAVMIMRFLVCSRDG
jgi:hypothetical protein